MIQVTNYIPIYEINGEKTSALNPEKIIVDSHWNNNQKIMLKMPNGDQYTVLEEDIIVAFRIATNTGR